MEPRRYDIVLKTLGRPMHISSDIRNTLTPFTATYASGSSVQGLQHVVGRNFIVCVASRRMLHPSLYFIALEEGVAGYLFRLHCCTGLGCEVSIHRTGIQAGFLHSFDIWGYEYPAIRVKCITAVVSTLWHRNVKCMVAFNKVRVETQSVC